MCAAGPGAAGRDPDRPIGGDRHLREHPDASGPAHVHVVVSTRADPDLPLARCGFGVSWSRSGPPTCASPPTKQTRTSMWRLAWISVAASISPWAENVTGVVIPEAGHFIPDEQPDATVDALTAFIDHARVG